MRLNDLRQRDSKTFGRLQSANKSEVRGSRKTVATAVLLLILALPSLWLIFSTPPLWRDSDAYVQTVYPLNAGTILAHAPLYCILSRVPLWLGYLTSEAGPMVRLGHFIKHTQLTDSGVFALIFVQHAALWWAALFFISTATTQLWSRLLLAIFFASHPLFYAFAHCIGSETLSMIIILLLAAAGLRIVTRYPDILMQDWILFGALLCGAILTRHINGVLVALLPITIFLITLVQSLHKSLACRGAASAANFTFGRSARVWCASVVTGLIALLFATGVTHWLCWQAHIHCRSKVGYTFAWRLNFINQVPLGSRDQFLAAAASRCQLPETRQLLMRLAERFRENQPWDPAAFHRESQTASAAPGGKFGKVEDEKYDRSLNEMSYAFLYPPSSALWSAVLQDFEHATQLREADVVHYLFLTTDYVFDHAASLPQCARLKTFREPRTKLASAANQFYFRWWNPISFRLWSIIFLLLLLMAVFMKEKAQTDDGRVVLYAVILFVFGVTMVLLNFFFSAIQPRFALPMMELLILSTMILLGVIFRACKIFWRSAASEQISSTPP